jgi:D-alanyl-D-alanine carboxypeptidase
MKTLATLVGIAILTASIAPASAQQLAPETAAKVAAIANKVLADTGVPSASVGIVENGHVVYTHAFGLARVSPPLTAEAAIAYPNRDPHPPAAGQALPPGSCQQILP